MRTSKSHNLYDESAPVLVKLLWNSVLINTIIIVNKIFKDINLLVLVMLGTYCENKHLA